MYVGELSPRLPSSIVTYTTTQAARKGSCNPGIGSARMAGGIARVAVIGCGISGAVCASTLAAKGVAVTVFESGRGAGGRMSQRREVTDDGRELFFDHGAPFFTVEDEEVLRVVKSWEDRGLVAEWDAKFGVFDRTISKFEVAPKEDLCRKYIGIPGMNSICKALVCQPGVEAKFGVPVSNLQWLDSSRSWALTALDGQNLGDFDGVVAADKAVCSPRFSGQVPPLDMSVINPELDLKLQHIPVRSCFAAMLAFSEPLHSIPWQGFLIKNSDVLSWAFSDSSKPGRVASSPPSECWVLHSTAEYAAGIIARTGLKKPSAALLKEVAEDLFKEFQVIGGKLPQPFFIKAHRWGSAFPAISVAGEDRCLVDESKRLAVCGDFCVSPNVEGAVLSGMHAASRMLKSPCLL